MCDGAERLRRGATWAEPLSSIFAMPLCSPLPNPPSPSLDADIVKALARHEHSALYLKFHALVVERCGVACVVRTIVDRKTA
jgi:hypothetical protein